MNIAVLPTFTLRLVIAIVALCIALGAGSTMFALPVPDGGLSSNDDVAFQEGEETADEGGTATDEPEGSPTPVITAPEPNEDRENTLIALGIGTLAGMVLLGLAIGLYGYLGD